jgi:hypothetical protein
MGKVGGGGRDRNGGVVIVMVIIYDILRTRKRSKLFVWLTRGIIVLFLKNC